MDVQLLPGLLQRLLTSKKLVMWEGLDAGLTPSRVGLYLSSSPTLEGKMIQVKLKSSGKVITVTANQAHGLIESGKAIIYTNKKTREMKPGPKKGYKTKGF